MSALAHLMSWHRLDVRAMRVSDVAMLIPALNTPMPPWVSKFDLDVTVMHILYARHRRGRIMEWRCPSVGRPSVAVRHLLFLGWYALKSTFVLGSLIFSIRGYDLKMLNEFENHRAQIQNGRPAAILFSSVDTCSSLHFLWINLIFGIWVYQYQMLNEFPNRHDQI